jgi:tRNA dimethylallyltransferase
MTSSDRPLLVILGPTAAGKTGLAIAIARALNGEIIGADSRQIYQHMNIGTAKPTAEQRAAVPHHLIDLIPPDGDLTLARYQRMTYDCIDAAQARGSLPMLVGGTGQYLTAVTEGWSIPEVPPDYALRNELEAFAAAQGADALHARLVQVDPDAAKRIHPNNVRRVIRALEVSQIAGQPISVLQRKRPPPYRIKELGLTLERPLLYEQADARVDQMIAEGFLAEVRRLLDMGYSRSLPSMSGLGYRELAAHLLDGVALEAAIADTKVATHDFIRRQETWFRGHDNGILWHNVRQIDPGAIVAICARWLSERP